MKLLRLLLPLTLAVSAAAQATGTITVNSTLTAVGTSASETLTCTIAPTTSRSGVTVNCSRGATLGALAQHNEDLSIAGQSNTWTLNLNGNALSLILTQGTPVGSIAYQVAVNGVTKSGTF